MFRKNHLRFAFQKRPPPPDIISIRQSLPPTANFENNKIDNAVDEFMHNPDAPASNLDIDTSSVLFLLSKLPREGTTVQQLSEKMINSGNSKLTTPGAKHHLAHLAHFARCIEHLRMHCYDVVRFVRISGNGQEKILWNETSSTHDSKRLSLDSIKKTFEILATKNINTRANAGNDDIVPESSPGEESSSSVEKTDHGIAASSFVEDLVASLKRDVQQEREARIAGEEKIKVLEEQLMKLLQFIAKCEKLKKSENGK